MDLMNRDECCRILRVYSQADRLQRGLHEEGELSSELLQYTSALDDVPAEELQPFEEVPS